MHFKLREDLFRVAWADEGQAGEPTTSRIEIESVIQNFILILFTDVFY